MTKADFTLSAEGVSHHFGPMPALRQITLALAPQTFTCIVGPSGCGKSTLLRIFAGLLKPSTGRVYAYGKPIIKPNKHISLVFQQANLMPWRTVLKNLVLSLELEGVSKREQTQRAENLLELLGLTEFRDAYPATLSGGMAQRVAIGRALINDPDALLMDEPFGALDALTREQLGEELLRIWAADRKTVCMVTHSIREAVLLADRVLVMSPRPGAILADIPITLPRPRRLEMVTQAAFTALENEVRAHLRLT